MDNWLVTAVAAAMTAAAALATSLSGAPAHDPVPHAVGSAQQLRPTPITERAAAPVTWTAPVSAVQAAVAERPSRADGTHATSAAAAPPPAPAAIHPSPAPSGSPSASTSASSSASSPPSPRTVRTQPSPATGASLTLPLLTRSAQHAVRRAAVAARPLLAPDVPARRVIGIRQALGMRPAMGALGSDVSWPQCGGDLPMPLAAAQFVVVGLTNGPAFSPNHCLRRQAAWVRAHHRHVATYAVVSYPDRHELRRFGGQGPFPRHTTLGRLRNAGYHQAVVNLRRARNAGLHSPVLWIDLEPSSTRPWHGRTGLNAAVVRGLVHGYRSHGQRIGFYSTASIWRQIVGRLRFGAPEWRTAGPASPRAALGRCHERDATIQGGAAVLAQWWNNRRDHDLLCPGHQDAGSMAQWFQPPGR